MAIFISCLGLLGLVAFTASKRVKEIGIRKVLGASVLEITALLSRSYLGLILLGWAVAMPVSWMVLNQWLSNFAYKIESIQNLKSNSHAEKLPQNRLPKPAEECGF